MLNQLSMKYRFALILSILLIGFSTFGVWTYYAMKTLTVNGPVYERIIEGKDIVADVLPPPEFIMESYLVITELSAASEPEEINQLLERFKTLKDEYITRHEYWSKQSLENALQTPFLVSSYEEATKFYDEAEKNFLPAVKSKNSEVLQESLKKLRQIFKVHRSLINDVVLYTTERNKADEIAASEKIQWNKNGLISIFVVSAMMAIILTSLISRGIIRQLGGEPGDVSELANNIACGKLNNTITVRHGDTQSIVANMFIMQQKLLARITQDAEEKATALRINQALNNVHSSVMVADPDLNIIYLNKSLEKLFTEGEQDIRKQLPNFKTDKLMGANIDIFHKHPAHQRDMLSRLTGTFRSEITIANLHLAVVVNPVMNDSNERIGFVVEWINRMNEVILDQEVSNALIAATQGDFSKHINEKDKSGLFLKLSQNINQLITVSSTSLNDVARVLNALSNGDLTETITNEYSGTFKQLKDDANATVESLKSLIGDIQTATQSITQAAREIASGNQDLSQRTEEQAASLEQTAASMDELTRTVQQNTDNSKQAERLAQGAKDVAGKGVDVVNDVVKTMESINESSHKIAEIISVIDGIAFQTNILALNAAVEAARAGDQGRGFAVVAGEVRNLAQRAAAAAGEIKTLIFDSEEKVSAGTKLVAQAGVTMHEIVDSINNVTLIMSQIANASVEQSDGIAQVNQAVRQMDDVTQQNAALVEQAAASAESLEEQTEHLTENVSKFKVVHPTTRSDQIRPSYGSYERVKSKTPTFTPRNLPVADKSNDVWEEF